ncbi:MAG: SHOCT domain-containing protein [Cellulomonas sp.]|uniref:SHOCT domain-containing protein n=1 Tax=Cellulomonas gelida TaxID=1712 RepID=A0A4Y3KQU4_9CELL|nr:MULTISPECIES: SHOCT domain-containing protein [Cellulomonas]KMM45948.1 hypothetical protein CWIS_07690 [Cellulomonas sp. A375-1]MCR6649377.1 SHOCT domain-containing protein [Cellulomonas sp.]MCR6705355.1 SHOCT domain-containing protein [Cellulomonas sp.]GEA85330.1 hypothetical protein CGE01nite_25810 [Cellulomonas gelida]GGL18753.1 hypothetical protein GCM10009774_06360 [Cellulomonas gelida]
MPGLIRGVARTAVVAGTASAVSGRVQRRQQGRWAAQDAAAQQPSYAAPQPAYAEPQPAYAAPQTVYAVPVEAAAPSMDDKISQLKELASLRDAGVLTPEEFDAQKARLLG